MKTQIVKNLFLLATLLQTAAYMVGCSSGGGSNATPIVSTSGYGLNSAGQCVYTSTGAVAPSTSYCTSTAGYGLNSAGQCVYVSTGAIAPSTSYCTTGVGTNGYTLNPTTGQCISTTTGQIAPSTSYCTTGVGTNGYTLNPTTGQCISTTTGQIAPSTAYCTTGVGGVAGYGQCIGQYSYYGQVGTCQSNGYYNNCSGYTLTNIQTGQTQYCQ